MEQKVKNKKQRKAKQSKTKQNKKYNNKNIAKTFHDKTLFFLKKDFLN